MTRFRLGLLRNRLVHHEYLVTKDYCLKFAREWKLCNKTCRIAEDTVRASSLEMCTVDWLFIFPLNVNHN